MLDDVREETREGFLVRVVDDDASMRRSWQFLIEGEGWSVKTYDTATAFLNEDDPSVPGCVILDVRMPEMSGIEMQMEMQVRDNTLPIVFVSAHGDIDMAVQALKDGAVDFLPKPVKAERLLDAIEKAVEKDIEGRRHREEFESICAVYNKLTAREKDIAKMIAEGMLNKQIAFELGISEKTVQAHRGSLCRKLHARNAADVTKILMMLETCPDA